MNYQTIQIRISIVLSLLIISCNRDQPEKTTSTPEEVLMSNRWVLLQTHVTSFDSVANRVVKDTVVLADSCNANAPYRFLRDSVCFKTMTCILSGATEKQGKWIMKNDSLSAYVPVRLSVGGGFIEINNGIEPSRLLQISNESFTVRRTVKWYGWSNGTNSVLLDTTVSTYRRF